MLSGRRGNVKVDTGSGIQMPNIRNRWCKSGDNPKYVALWDISAHIHENTYHPLGYIFLILNGLRIWCGKFTCLCNSTKSFVFFSPIKMNQEWILKQTLTVRKSAVALG
jgi:hypothetical protein